MSRLAAFLLLAGCASTDPATEVEIAAQIAFLEGPTAAADGTIYFSDIPNERILKLPPFGGRRAAATGR